VSGLPSPIRAENLNKTLIKETQSCENFDPVASLCHVVRHAGISRL